jgi:hypothetical protein
MTCDATPYDTGRHAGRGKYRTGKDTVNPNPSGSHEAKMWGLGYDDGFSQAEAQDKGDDYDDYESESHD